MKTKISKLLAAALMILGTNAVKADEGNTTTTPTNTSGDVTLNIELKQILELKVNESNVSLVYAEKSDYQNGVTETMDNQLTVSATGGFQIKVVATDFSNVPDGKTLALGSVSIQPVAGTTDPIETLSQANFPLSTDTKTFVSSTKGGFDKNIGVKYIGAKNNEYLNILSNQNNLVMTSTVTYTIVPQ